jgi:hypothetical protein
MNINSAHAYLGTVAVALSMLSDVEATANQKAEAVRLALQELKDGLPAGQYPTGFDAARAVIDQDINLTNDWIISPEDERIIIDHAGKLTTVRAEAARKVLEAVKANAEDPQGEKLAQREKPDPELEKKQDNAVIAERAIMDRKEWRPLKSSTWDGIVEKEKGVLRIRFRETHNRSLEKVGKFGNSFALPSWNYKFSTNMIKWFQLELYCYDSSKKTMGGMQTITNGDSTVTVPDWCSYIELIAVIWEQVPVIEIESLRIVPIPKLAKL